MKSVVMLAFVYAYHYEYIRFVKGYSKHIKDHLPFRSRACRHLVVSIPTGGKSIPIEILWQFSLTDFTFSANWLHTGRSESRSRLTPKIAITLEPYKIT